MDPADVIRAIALIGLLPWGIALLEKALDL